MSTSHAMDTPVAAELAPLEPIRVPAQNLSAIARGPYDPAGQPRWSGEGFVLGVDAWNLLPWPAGLALVAEAERLGFGFAVATQAQGEHTLDGFAGSDTIAAETHSVLLAPSTSLRAHLHPLHVARFVANLDHVSGGRAALVFDAGEDAAGAARFGLEPSPTPNDETDEFVTLIKHGWAWSTPFDFAGDFYRSRRAWLCGPRPTRLPRPYLALRGGAEVAELAARSFDWWILEGEPSVDVARAARDRAAIAYGRSLDVIVALTVPAEVPADLGSRLSTLAESRVFRGVLLRFEDGLRGLHEFGTKISPALRAAPHHQTAERA